MAYHIIERKGTFKVTRDTTRKVTNGRRGVNRKERRMATVETIGFFDTRADAQHAIDRRNETL